MLPRQMAHRCPGARGLGPALLDGWRFIISKGGKANIMAGERCQVHGVLWACEPRHMALLDQWEGVAQRHYRRHRVAVALYDGADGADGVDGACRQCFVYVSSQIQPGSARPDYMMSAVIPGARAFSLPAHYIAELESWLPRRPIAGLSRRYRGKRCQRRQSAGTARAR